jgi:hypothetical protein
MWMNPLRRGERQRARAGERGKERRRQERMKFAREKSAQGSTEKVWRGAQIARDKKGLHTGLAGSEGEQSGNRKRKEGR